MLRHLVERFQVEAEILHLVIFDADIRAVIIKDEVLQPGAVRGHTAGDKVPGVVLHGDIDGLPRLRVITDHIAEVVAVAGADDLGGEGAEGLAVHEQHGLVPADVRHDEQRFARQFRRDGIGSPEPAVGPLARPFHAGCGCFKGQVGDRMVLPVHVAEGHVGQLPHLFKDAGLELLLKTDQFFQHSFDLGLIQHIGQRPFSSEVFLFSLSDMPPICKRLFSKNVRKPAFFRRVRRRLPSAFH